MKTLTLNLRTTVSLLGMYLFISSYAVAGGMSGGQGSSAFALQRIQSEHPMMSKEEVLVQAFKEAEGKPVELIFQPADDGKEEAWILNARVLSTFGSIFFGAEELKGSTDFYIRVTRNVYDSGPIFRSEITYSNYRVQMGKILSAPQSFVIPKFDPLNSIKFNSNGSKFEIRQLDKNTVLIGFIANVNGSCEHPFYDIKPISGICGVVSYFVKK